MKKLLFIFFLVVSVLHLNAKEQETRYIPESVFFDRLAFLGRRLEEAQLIVSEIEQNAHNPEVVMQLCTNLHVELYLITPPFLGPNLR